MDDLISRQAAIDALIQKRLPVHHEDGTTTITGLSDRIIQETLEALPSAEPKTAASGSYHSQNGRNDIDRTTNDVISRQAAIDALNCDITVTGCQNAELVAATMGTFVDRIKALPSAEPRMKGKWVGIDDYPHESWECDQCGCVYEEMPSWTPNFCPNCGADMRGEEDD